MGTVKRELSFQPRFQLPGQYAAAVGNARFEVGKAEMADDQPPQTERIFRSVKRLTGKLQKQSLYYQEDGYDDVVRYGRH